MEGKNGGGSIGQPIHFDKPSRGGRFGQPPRSRSEAGRKRRRSGKEAKKKW